MKQEELDRVLQQHQLWLESGGVKGERADLRHADLQGADLRDADLWGADLRHAKIDTNIRGCYNFCNAKFTTAALPWLILHPNWLKFKDTVQIFPD